MDQRHLRAFVSVADLGGISAAAERLGYAQSTLSVQLQRLERDLGASLFNRSNAGAALTEEGQRLLPYAREALNLEDEMRRVVRSGRRGCASGHWRPWPASGCRTSSPPWPRGRPAPRAPPR